MSTSGVFQLTDTNDFIHPAKGCVKVQKSSQKKREAREAEYSVSKEAEDAPATKKDEAQASLNDCLACNACITSAESILVTSQSVQEFTEQMRTTRKTVVVTVSPQSRASFAAKFGIAPLDVASHLASFFRTAFGGPQRVRYVLDSSAGRSIAHYALKEEWRDRSRRARAGERNVLPLLVSACPGWVCYAEKSHHSALPLLSRVRSPQAIMGSLVKTLLREHGDSGNNEGVYHVTVMPCYDKKLEASRSEFADDAGGREVDLVLVTSEVETLLDGRDLRSFSGFAMDSVEDLLRHARRNSGISLPTHVPDARETSSGGWLQAVHRAALGPASEDLRLAAPTKIKSDVFELAEGEGKMAAVYGFKNIQNLVRKLRTGACKYSAVEVMACPSGCVNGGGQLKGDAAGDGQRWGSGSLVDGVEEMYAAEFLGRGRVEDEGVAQLLAEWGASLGAGQKLDDLLHTSYKAVTRSIVDEIVPDW